MVKTDALVTEMMTVVVVMVVVAVLSALTTVALHVKLVFL